MAYIDKEKLKSFCSKYPDDDSLLEGYCQSAMEIVENYLGYDPESKAYSFDGYGEGAKVLRLDARPITSIDAISVNDTAVDVSAVTPIKKSNYIAFEDHEFFYSSVKYHIEYTAGYTEVPQAIVTAALQVASLIWESSGGNLAVTSTSFGDMGGRTFQSFDPKRYLEGSIKSYRVERVDY